MLASVPGGARASSYRLIAGTLWLGAAYDFAVAVVLLVAPAALAARLGLLPPEPVYLRLIAILLLILGATYAATAIRVSERRDLVWIAITGRLLGGGLLCLEGIGSSRPGFLVLGALDLGFAVLHLAALTRRQ